MRLTSCCCSAFHAPAKLSLLKSRKVLRIAGADATHFLQGLVTNDIERLKHSQSAIFSAILNAQGRVLFDIFIQQPPHEPDTYYIDHEAKISSTLAMHLKRHILRSKVKMSDVSDQLSVMQLWSSSGTIQPSSDVLSSLGGFADPRTAGLGYRFLAPSSAIRPDLGLEEEVVDESYYRLLRTTLGVPEGTSELPPGQALPLESNLDYMSAIDFRKGCYVGQELTSRTHHTGVTRKRIVPVRLFPTGEAAPSELIPTTFSSPQPLLSPPTGVTLPSPQTDIKPIKSTVAKPRPSGKLCSTLSITSTGSPTVAHIGLALVRLEQMETPEAIGESEKANQGVFSVASDGTWSVKAFAVDWWKEKAIEHGLQRR